MENKIRRIMEQFKNYRLTPQRRIVLEILMENSEKHLSAEEVYQLSREKGYEIGLATIYRTLELLETLSLLHKMNFGDGKSRYELVEKGFSSQEHHHHHHLLCLQCEKVLEVEDDLLQQLEKVVEDKYGFDIVDHSLQFIGYCSECKEKGSNN